MKFTSLQEYFYKIQAMIFLVLLAPLMAFTAVILGLFNHSTAKNNPLFITFIFCAVAIFTYTVAISKFRKKIKKATKLVGLSLKLDQYYAATILHYALGTTACLVAVAGFLLTAHFIFTLIFALVVFLLFIRWPRPSKVCRDLMLRGDEREMVLAVKCWGVYTRV